MQHRAMANLAAISRYFLYGEPPSEVELDFLQANLKVCLVLVQWRA